MTTNQREPGTIEIPLAAYPGIRPFPLDLVSGSAAAARLSSRPGIGSVAPRPPSIDRSPLAAALDAANRAWGNDVGAPLERWAKGASVAVIAGQQVGFAGGPLLTLTKIASLVKICRRLEARGIGATPFFWMATEDHDYGEVASLDWPLSDGGIVEIRATHSRATPRVVGDDRLPQSMVRQIRELIAGGLPRWLRDGITFRDSFAELIAAATAGSGVVLVDSLSSELRRAGQPLLQSIARQMPELAKDVGRRSAEIVAAGYEPQVVPNQDGQYTMLYFVEPDGERLAVRRGSDGWTIGDHPAAEDDVMRRIAERPESVSTGALTRPLLQDFVFEPAVFIGGPAEVAYYSQILPLHEMLGIRPPHVALRGHLLVASHRTLAARVTYGLTDDELATPVDEILARREKNEVAALEREVDALESAIETTAARVRDRIVAADVSLERSIARTMRRMQFHAAKLRDRGVRAIARRDSDRHRAVRRLAGTLFPGGIPQDRRAAWVALWIRHGSGLFETLVQNVEPDRPVYTIAGV